MEKSGEVVKLTDKERRLLMLFRACTPQKKEFVMSAAETAADVSRKYPNVVRLHHIS